MKLMHTLNLKDELKDKKNEIMKEILMHKKNNKTLDWNVGSIHVCTKYDDYLYDLFIKKSRKLLNPFTIKNPDLKVWCYFTGLGDSKKDTWHNHLKTSTINSVLYLETIKGCGINFRNKKEVWYVEPKEFDLLIFPASLDHLPVTSPTQQRVSLNLELVCNENEREIFGS